MFFARRRVTLSSHDRQPSSQNQGIPRDALRSYRVERLVSSSISYGCLFPQVELNRHCPSVFSKPYACSSFFWGGWWVNQVSRVCESRIVDVLQFALEQSSARSAVAFLQLVAPFPRLHFDGSTSRSLTNLIRAGRKPTNHCRRNLTAMQIEHLGANFRYCVEIASENNTRYERKWASYHRYVGKEKWRHPRPLRRRRPTNSDHSQ